MVSEKEGTERAEQSRENSHMVKMYPVVSTIGINGRYNTFGVCMYKGNKRE